MMKARYHQKEKGASGHPTPQASFGEGGRDNGTCRSLSRLRRYRWGLIDKLSLSGRMREWGLRLRTLSPRMLGAPRPGVHGDWKTGDSRQSSVGTDLTDLPPPLWSSALLSGPGLDSQPPGSIPQPGALSSQPHSALLPEDQREGRGSAGSVALVSITAIG
ncbi:hypothetical protein EYF80_016485 [Liparis tanakae]|uniref:Uncharacterized protein n=1 Tax=Liparis tanakae TaxID=230148 RepID=A0A4Z2I7S3_9TELE|nr:hypothetical protein EYF80_016485 [Liparis tanakae]